MLMLMFDMVFMQGKLISFHVPDLEGGCTTELYTRKKIVLKFLLCSLLATLFSKPNQGRRFLSLLIINITESETGIVVFLGRLLEDIFTEVCTNSSCSGHLVEIRDPEASR
uniref:Myb-like protein X isoform X2 n=1 Tax=Rhizophora mucronata TaxID=61149 RepID=A0A2P2IV40_RHIMU